MGARPRAALLSLVLPESIDVADVDSLLRPVIPAEVYADRGVARDGGPGR